MRPAQSCGLPLPLSWALLLADDTPLEKRAIVECLVAQWRRVAQEYAVLRKPQMRSFANWGATKLDGILDSHAIPSFMSGGHRVVPVDAFFKYLIDLAIKSPPKASKPGSRFVKKTVAAAGAATD